MEFKRRRMIRSELDRLLSDEGTRNLLRGVKLLNKNKKLTRIVTRRNSNKRTPNGQNNSNISNGASPTSTNNKTKKIIKKSLSLLGHRGKISNNTPNGNSKGSSSSSSSNSGASGSSGGNHHGVVSNHNLNSNNISKPILATSVRNHVAFVTLSYQNHLCTINTQDIQELMKKLEECESRDEISVIVLNSSSDRIFCDGFDYKELIHSDLNKRKQAVQKRIQGIKNLLMALAKSKKLLVASLNGGEVNGFGLMLLALFDLVYANDKATFSLQKYVKFKQPPEGISAFNAGQLVLPIMKSFVFTGRVCTSSEMFESNLLVTEILWDGGRYHEQLACRLQNVNIHQNTKSIYKTYSSKNIKQLSNDLAHEFNLLESIWLSDSWQINFQQNNQ